MNYYLTIPYGLKDQVKARVPGVRWDPEVKCWYATEKVDACKAQTLANELAGRTLQKLPHELMGDYLEAVKQEEAQADLYTGKHIKLSRVNGANRQPERIAEAQKAVKPGFFEKGYTAEVTPSEESSFSLTFSAADDSEARRFAGALKHGQILRNLVLGGIASITIKDGKRVLATA